MSAIITGKRYTMFEVARLLHVHIATIWRWYLRGVRGRKLKTVVVGARRYVLADDLDAFLAAGNSERPVEETDFLQRAEQAGQALDALRTGGQYAK